MRDLNFIKGSRAIAAALGVHPQTVLNLVHRGELPAFVLGNKLVMRQSELEAWVHEREAEAKSRRV